jgi:hypothetical protein
MFAYGPSTGALLRRCGFQVLFQAGPDPLFLAYAEPGDHRAQQPEGALGLDLSRPAHACACGSGSERSTRRAPLMAAADVAVHEEAITGLLRADLR